MAWLAVRIECDERDGPAGELRVLVVAQLGGDGDHTGGAPGQDLLDPLAVRRVVSVHVGARHSQAVGLGDLADAADEFQRPQTVEGLEEDLDDGRGLGPLRPALPAVLTDQLFDPAPGGDRHARAPVDHLGHRRRGHPGQSGDLRDRDLLAAPRS